MYYRIFRSVYYRQALAIITPYIAPFRADPFVASGRLLAVCSRASWRRPSVRAASWQCCGVVRCWRYIYAADWCSLAALNAARAANGKIYVSSSFPRNYINIFIYYAESEEDTHVLRFASKRTFRTQTGGTGRRVCWRACIWRRAVCCAGVLCVWLPAGLIHPHRRGTPP